MYASMQSVHTPLQVPQVRIHKLHIDINLASCGILEGKQTMTVTCKTQLARLNICSDWGKPLIK